MPSFYRDRRGAASGGELPVRYDSMAAGGSSKVAEMTSLGGGVVTDDLAKAIDLAIEGQWDTAHRIVQQYETDRTAAWIHAVLHKIEGDLDNSRYWYRRAGKIECVEQDPMGELQSIKAAMN
jgi:hypothetical protein